MDSQLWWESAHPSATFAVKRADKTNIRPRRNSDEVVAMPMSSDPYVRFADERDLRVTAEALPVAPRDLLQQPADSELHFLATISKSVPAGPSARLIFMLPPGEGLSPSVRDILWWLASDAWSIEQTNRDFGEWAGLHDYRPNDEATRRLFERHVRIADELRAVLGDVDYRKLLALHESEIGPRS